MLTTQEMIEIIDQLLDIPSREAGKSPEWDKGYVAMREKMRRIILKKYRQR